MDQKSWKKVDFIFNAALEVELSRRQFFIVAEADGDHTVLFEVQQLLAAHEEAGSSFVRPGSLVQGHTLSAAPLAIGDLLGNRFRIVREIAEGGMGHVFEAFDTELSLPVALKVIRSEIAANEQAIARFRQEVRLARSVSHPNVCRTFDIERDVHLVNGGTTELLFLTMEFLPGETLASRIKRDGPIPAAEALEIARQIASGMCAAHALGIIHRDIKPTNIMLVRRESDTEKTPYAVIMDFGLARLDSVSPADTSSGLTNTRHPIGTLAYMAPEQLGGASVSPATDIYAFGLVLFEMITGQRAFPSTSLLTGIGRRMRGSSPLEPLERLEVPANWRQGITECLRVLQSDRPPTPAAVIAILESDQPSTLRGLGKSCADFWRKMPRAAAFCTAILIAMSLFFGGLRLYQSRADSQIQQGALVYLVPVQNLTGDKAFDSTTDLIKAGLTQSVQISLLDRTRTQDILRQMNQPPESVLNPATAREVAMRTGAVRLVLASLSKTSEEYRLHLDLQQPDNVPTRFRRHWTHDWIWSRETEVSTTSIGPETAATMREASAWIRAKVGESANDIARFDTPPEEATTSSWQALADFNEGERLFGTGKRQEAITSLQSAIAHDHQFALAEAFEGDILANLGQSQAAYELYQKALETGSTGRLTLRERDRVLGIIAHDTWDELAAEAAYRDSTLFYGHDYDGWFRLARPLIMLGRPQDSLFALEQAHQIDPSKPAAVVQLVRVELALEDTNGATWWLHELEQHYPRDWYLFAYGPAQFVHRDYNGAAQSFSTMTHSQNETLRKVGYALLASVRAEQGHFAEAAAIESQAIAREPNDPDELIHRAALFCRLGQVQSCMSDIEQALKLEPGPRMLIPASEILGLLIGSGGSIATRARHELTFLKERLSAPRYGLVSDIAQHRVLGEIYLSNNQPAAAVAEFRKADALDAPYKPREYLARALVAQAGHTADHVSVGHLLQEATKLHGIVALHPMVVWYFPIPYLPGAYADESEAWLRLEKRLARPEEETHMVAARLAELRQ